MAAHDQPEAVPSLTFDTRDLPVGQRFPAWCAALSTYRARLPDDAAADGFQATSRSWLLEDMVVSATSLPAVHLSRTPELIASDGAGRVNVFLLRHGHAEGLAAGRPYRLSPGQVIVYDLGQPFEGGGGPSESIAISTTRQSLLPYWPDPANLHGRILEGAGGALLADHMLALVRHLPAMSLRDVPGVARATSGVIAAALSGLPRGSEPDPREASILAEAFRRIEADLTSPDLTPESLEARLGVARSSLYRSFRPFGGIAAYILRRRLETVRMLLGEPSERRSLAELAETFGFSSAAHFSTAFRRLYGVSPRDVRAGIPLGEPAEAAAIDEPTARFRAWIDRLGRTAAR